MHQANPPKHTAEWCLLLSMTIMAKLSTKEVIDVLSLDEKRLLLLSDFKQT